MCVCTASCEIAHRPCQRIEAAHTTFFYGIGHAPAVSAPWPKHHMHTRRETVRHTRRDLSVGAPLLATILMPAIDSRNLRLGRSISGDDLLAHLRTERGLCHGIISRDGPADPQVVRIDSGHQDGFEKRCADSQVAP